MNNDAPKKGGAFEPEEEPSAVRPIVAPRADPREELLRLARDSLGVEALLAPIDARLDEMLKRLQNREYFTTLALCDSVLADNPAHGLAMVCREECQAAVLPEGPEAVPVLQWPLSELANTSLDKGARTLLAYADGVRSTEEVIAESGLPRERALRAIYDLIKRGVLRLK